MDDERDPIEDPRLREVVDDLRAAFLTPPDDDAARTHLDRLFAEPTTVVPLRGRRRTGAAIAAGALAAAVLGIGGVAAADGSLPGPLQRGVSALVGVVGVDVPDGDDDETDAPDSGGGGVGSTTSPSPTDPTEPTDRTEPTEPAEPTDVAPPVVDPGRRQEAPGQTGEDPGRSGTAPGQTGTPGETDNRPEVPPGQSGDQGNKPEAPPGQGQVTPGQGQGGTSGASGDNPSVIAPGQVDKAK